MSGFDHRKSGDVNSYIDDIIHRYQQTLAEEYLPYKNHVHRIANLALKLKRKVEDIDLLKIAIAAVHHDIGIWTANTFDYLTPSIVTAKEYLIESGRNDWSNEIVAIIEMHHKICPYKGDYEDNVEAFRKADFIDLTNGIRRFGLTTEFVKNNLKDYPALSFRKIITKKFFQNFVRHPFRPLPMIKL